MRAIVRALAFSPGSRGLDAGCGIGSHTLLLAEAVAPGGHVIGLDRSPALLARAGETARRSSMSGQVLFQEGDLTQLPFPDGSFDWLWSVDCASFIPVPPVTLLGELSRVVKPGGTVAIIVWSSQQLLPGYPILEARLNATSLGIAPFFPGQNPERHFMRALEWLREAGLQETTARTFVGEAHAPLTDELRESLASLIDMRWGQPQAELTPEDRAEFERVCLPNSPAFILNVPGYYAFFTYSLFRGRVPGRAGP